MRRARWIRKIGRIEAIRLEPGDVLVVTSERPISNDEAQTAREHLRHWFPGHDSLFLPPGWQVQPVRRDEIT